MDRNVFQTELDGVRFTPAGREALTEALTRGGESAPAPRRISWAKRGLAAGLAAAVLVGSALAVSGPIWSHFFGSLDEEQQAVLETLSQALPAAECNGTVMTPLEAFGDENFYYLLLEIVPPEGVVLPDYSKEENQYLTRPESGISIKVGVGDSEARCYQFMNPETDTFMTLLDGEGNDIRQGLDYHWAPRADEDSPLVVAIRLWGEGNVNFADGTDKILRIPGLWVENPGKNYTPILTGSWDFNIGAYTGGVESRTLDTAGISTEDEAFGTVTLDSLRLSPLGLRFRFSWDHAPEEDRYMAPGVKAVVVMEDGSEVRLENSMGELDDKERWQVVYGPFEAPIDLDKAVAVRWGTALLSLKGK